MIIKKILMTRKYRNSYDLKNKWVREGWFLFGFIPLYVRDLEIRNAAL